MWLYIPTSVSAAVQEDSTSGLTEAQAELLSRSVTLREKSPPPRRWSAILRKERWLMLLSGLTLKPSTSQRGVDKWKESWVATHVSLGAQQTEIGWEKPIPVTSGLTSKQESRQLDLFGASLKMSPVIFPWASIPSRKAYEAWATKLRQHSLQRRKSGQVTNANDYSSWPTPVARDVKGGGVDNGSLIRSDGKHRLDTLDRVSVRWDPTHLVRPTVDGTTFRSDYSLRRLNPDFVDWMMGWADGWTSLGQTVSALLGTELSPNREPQHGESYGEK
jgi:hypothetical protein